MKQAKNRRAGLLSYVVLFSAIMAMVFALAGCGPEELPSESGEAVAEVVLEPTAAPATPTDEATVTPEPVAEVVEPPEPDTCLDCHTDKDLLIDTADPEEEVINENEGEG